MEEQSETLSSKKEICLCLQVPYYPKLDEESLLVSLLELSLDPSFLNRKRFPPDTRTLSRSSASSGAIFLSLVYFI